MSRIPAFVSRLVLGTLAIAASAQAAPTCPDFAEPAAAAKVATVGGKPITRAEVDEKLGEALCAARMEHAQKIHELRTQALESLINDRLIEQAAKAAGAPDTGAWLMTQLQAAVKPVDPAAVQAFYNENQQRMGGKPFEEMQGPIAQYLDQQGKEQAYGDLLAKLREAAKVEELMAPFRLPVEAVGPASGPEKAPITLIEFADYECGYCARATETVKAVRAKYGDKIRFVFRDFPLEFHKNAAPAAIAARCAAAQGKYWEMHDALFENSQGLGAETYGRLATQLGLDMGAYMTCMGDPAQMMALQADMAAGRKAGVSGTPAFFINGIPLSGAQPVEAFTKIIDAELARKPGK
ncbi:MAG: thioredoxin domain-containing protein [Myxococcales bacterium]|nr:thioredoxin domain-containing protein [Myxococcales bacterium]MCB9548236.1 thioredoxin domain-containing protein [Myxococcales bacterium]